MITCEKCQHEFMADYQQGYPGHCDPPSSLISYAVLFLVIAGLLGVVGYWIRSPVLFAVLGAFVAGAFDSLTSIPEARRVCESSGGGVCPSCGHKNQVKWTS